MITVIRKRVIQSKVYKVIIWGMIIVLSASFGIPGLMNQSKNPAWIATVNGDDIDYQEYLRQVANQEYFLQMFRQQYGSYSDTLLQAMGFSSNPQVLAMKALVRNSLMNQAADSLGLAIHNDYLEEKLSDPYFVQRELTDVLPPSLVSQQGINNEQFKKYLQKSHLSFTEFEQLATKALQRSVLKDLAMSSAYMPRFERENYYSLEYAPKKFAVATFSLDDCLVRVKKTPISSAELEAFFKQQNEQFKRYYVPEKRSGKSWKFDPQSFGIAVTQQEIDEYYHAHKKQQYVALPSMLELRHIVFHVENDEASQDVYKKACAIREELVKKPEDFATKAQHYSDDKETAMRGGLMAPFKRGTQEPIIERTGYLLKADGDISDVIKTSRGFELLQRVRKVPQTYKKITEVSAEIRDELMRQKFSSEFERSMERCVRNNDSKTLEAIIAEKNPKMTELSLVTHDSSKVRETLFSLQEGNFAYYLEGMHGYLVQVTKINKTYAPHLSTIKERVESDYYDQKAGAELDNVLKQARAELSHKNLEEISKTMHAKFEYTQMVKKTDTGKVAGLRAQGLPVEKMLQMEKENLVILHRAARHGFLICLDKIGALDQASVQKQAVDFIGGLEQEKARLSFVSFVASLHRNATIKQNDSIINS